MGKDIIYTYPSDGFAMESYGDNSDDRKPMRQDMDEHVIFCLHELLNIGPDIPEPGRPRIENHESHILAKHDGDIQKYIMSLIKDKKIPKGASIPSVKNIRLQYITSSKC